MKHLPVILAILVLAGAGCRGTPPSSDVLRANPGGPYSAISRRDVTMTGATSTAGPFPIAFFRWNCGQDPIKTPSEPAHEVACNQLAITPTFRYSKAGTIAGGARTYTVTLEVEDTAGNKHTATTTVSVSQAY